MIYIFNPDHDLAIADFSPYYTPPASIVKMMGDLAVLPLWYSDGHPVVADGEQNMHYFEHIKRLLPIKSTLISSDDIINYLDLAGVRVSKGEISAILRKEGHRNYKPCGDRYARNFLKGLMIEHRGE